MERGGGQAADLESLHESIQIGSVAPRTVCVVCRGLILKWLGSTVYPILRGGRWFRVQGLGFGSTVYPILRGGKRKEDFGQGLTCACARALRAVACMV